MLEIETGYIKVVDGKHKIIDYPCSADEVNLEVDEYYAIFVPESMIDKVEVDAPYYDWGKTERGEEYHIYGFSDYQSYIHEIPYFDEEDD